MKKTKTDIYKVVNCNRGDEFYIKVIGKCPKLTDEKFKKLIFDEFCWNEYKAEDDEWKNDVLVERVSVIELPEW